MRKESEILYEFEIRPSFNKNDNFRIYCYFPFRQLFSVHGDIEFKINRETEELNSTEKEILSILQKDLYFIEDYLKYKDGFLNSAYVYSFCKQYKCEFLSLFEKFESFLSKENQLRIKLES